MSEEAWVLLPMTCVAQVDVAAFRKSLEAVRPFGGSDLHAGVKQAVHLIDEHESAAARSTTLPPADTKDPSVAEAAPASAPASAAAAAAAPAPASSATASASASASALSNRLILLSDFRPTLGEPKRSVAQPTEDWEFGFVERLAQCADRKKHIIYTTLFVVGLDANTHVAQAVAAMRGGNCFTAGGLDAVRRYRLAALHRVCVGYN